MMNQHICPSCHCSFKQVFLCTTCGAEKLKDESTRQLERALHSKTEALMAQTNEINQLRAELEAVKKERDGLDRRATEYAALNDWQAKQLAAVTKERDIAIGEREGADALHEAEKAMHTKTKQQLAAVTKERDDRLSDAKHYFEWLNEVQAKLDSCQQELHSTQAGNSEYIRVLEDRVEKCQLDAERYRWLRKNQYVDYDCIWAEQPKLDWPPAESDIYDDHGKKLDWVIDASIAAMQKEQTT